ncbi:hypothetical protein RND81_03G081000 [Saponaria officinalis]|uniref:Spore coat protein n=1 Tax=Saponaria officinalis TaxID=3572 RepID=A0AAW1M516_SAPOF
MRSNFDKVLANEATILSQMETLMINQNQTSNQVQNLDNRVGNLENYLGPMFTNVCGYYPGEFRPETAVYRPPQDFNFQQPMHFPPFPEGEEYSFAYPYPYYPYPPPRPPQE